MILKYVHSSYFFVFKNKQTLLQVISVFLENNDKILRFPFWDQVFFQNMPNRVHFYAKKRAFFFFLDVRRRYSRGICVLRQENKKKFVWTAHEWSLTLKKRKCFCFFPIPCRRHAKQQKRNYTNNRSKSIILHFL